MRRSLLALLLALSAACDGGSATTAPPAEDTPQAVDTIASDWTWAIHDTALDTAKDTIPKDWSTDLVTDLPPMCAPGEGCFGDPCTDSGDCLSGFCVGHMGDQVCTVECLEDCPSGWTCKQIGVGPDVIFACVSPYTHLCRPCVTSDDCDSLDGGEDACLVLGSHGSFCGAACAEAGDCPEGFSCLDAATAEGGAAKQCVPIAQICACSGTAIALGLSTACWNENEFGTCHGLRICSPDGLSPCSAPEPAEEVCNGVDDDCNGETDEITCDDGNECTEDSCDIDAGCVHTALTGVECTDGDVCTLADNCVAGVCTGTLISCDDDNLCTTDTCEPAGGCKYSYNSLPCDDGNPCTVGDGCAQGVCAGVPVDCECQDDDDCLLLEDGDVCNGTLYCDTDDLPHKCGLVPDSIVECEEPVGVDAVCLTAACDPIEGKCGFVPINEEGACDDQDICTLGDICDEGECIPGVTFSCDDGNPCTHNYCEPEGGCVNPPNLAPCDDGNPCTVGDQCADGVCVTQSLISCDDGNLCTDDSCDLQSGCVHIPNDAPCDDGNDCTVGEACLGGACVGGSALPCNDGNLCTDDSCKPAQGCLFVDNTNPCNDGDPCTTSDACTDGVCVGAGEKNCNDGNSCTDDVCEALGGCVHLPNDASCSDDNPCTTGDQCEAGVCVADGQLECDDGNPCTDDACSPDTGCVSTANTAPCNDGDACTLDDVCSEGACVGSGVLACEDGNPCTDDDCDGDAGCSHSPNDATCDDGNACTEVDACAAGACIGSVAPDCDDGNLCTDDACATQSGCTHAFNDAPCDDGNLCTLGDVCNQGACQGGGVEVLCDDGNPCTDDDCDGDAGCLHTPNTASCDDASACTEVDACVAGVCVGSVAPDCDDDNLCTDDACSAESGCTHVFNDATCDDADLCTLGDTCAQGACQAGGTLLPCDDGNLCTDDDCDPVAGCTFSPNNLACNDDNACTTGDVCSDGVCTPLWNLSCDDDNLCTDDLCNLILGCIHPFNAAPCDDGNLCTVGETCSLGSCEGGTVLNCADDNVCTVDLCHPETGCIHANNNLSCDDNDVCTLGDVCVGGDCQSGAPATCEDNDDCTDDACNPLYGCVFTPVVPCCGNGIEEPGEECDDGNDIPLDGCEVNCTDTLQATYHYKYLGTANSAQGGGWGNKICNLDNLGNEYVGYTINGQLGPAAGAGPHDLYGPIDTFIEGDGFYKFVCVYE